MTIGLQPDAMKPGFHCVPTHWIRGFMAFQLARLTRTVMLMVLVGPESGFLDVPPGRGSLAGAGAAAGGGLVNRGERAEGRDDVRRLRGLGVGQCAAGRRSLRRRAVRSTSRIRMAERWGPASSRR